MKLETTFHDPQKGWSARLPTSLDGPNTLVLAFGASALLDRPAPLAALYDAFPRSCIAGCSTAGEIVGTRIADGGVSVAVAAFDATELRRASAPMTSATDSYEAGRAVAAELTSARKPRAILVLSDGVCVNGSELIRGINAVTHGDVVVTGGLAGDGDRFQRTWVLDGGEPRSGRVTAVGLYGERLHVGFGSHGGWDIFGPERRVTKARGNVLYEIDNVPALALYKRYLGDRAQGLPATALLFPLAMRASSEDDQRLVRTILSVNEDEQSMTFAGDLPEGSLVQLMRANFDRLIGGAVDAAAQSRTASATSAATPTLAVAISCVGRRLVLGERAEEEVEVVDGALPDDSQLVGFYSYGEFSPRGLGSCDLHNQTMTLTTLSEA
jgi:hypothetical protein